MKRLLLLAAAAALAAGTGSALAQAFGNSFNGLQVSNDQPIAIESDQLDVDDAKSVATFTGNVNVQQGETLLKTSKLVVYYAKKPEGGAQPVKTAAAMPGGSNEIDRLEASGKVYVKSADQVATSEKANFDMKTQIVLMTGNVVMTQGENVARGETLTIHMDTGLARLGGAKSGGRVKILMAPNASQPAQ
ncbi:OstA family protein [Aureimonas sp. Leaf454]|uniref:LptA/OstA family protein n=1 Tax=Aureimonas sp. Leaf454 TaxID=1736381 RepID=UPI0006F2A952|nr:LptA/OstA family protein [Aureimonas sp. Leaf454]KQT43218.1 OstA family protein [Aureimonas sp. Leaf454]